MVRRAAERCGLTISSHDMRRGWAIESKRRGVDLGDIKKAAGWSTDAMADRYFGTEAGLLAVEAFHRAAEASTSRGPRRLWAVGS